MDPHVIAQRLANLDGVLGACVRVQNAEAFAAGISCSNNDVASPFRMSQRALVMLGVSGHGWITVDVGSMTIRAASFPTGEVVVVARTQHAVLKSLARVMRTSMGQSRKPT
jgi:hypothetical protein